MNLLCRIVAIAAFAVTAGCNTFSKQQCEQMDWSMQGRLAAMRGQTVNQGMIYYEQKCGETHGIRPDPTGFQTGFKEGLKEFCNPEYAYNFAIQGGSYRGTCPADSEKALLEKYHSGRTIYLEKKVIELKATVSELQSRVSSLEGRLSSCQSSVSSCESRASTCQH